MGYTDWSNGILFRKPDRLDISLLEILRMDITVGDVLHTVGLLQTE